MQEDENSFTYRKEIQQFLKNKVQGRTKIIYNMNTREQAGGNNLTHNEKTK